jgi:hypothetical protein
VLGYEPETLPAAGDADADAPTAGPDDASPDALASGTDDSSEPDARPVSIGDPT